MQIWDANQSKSGFGWVLGSIWAGVGEGFGRGLEALGRSWVIFWRRFFMLAFGMIFKRGLGGFWARFWFDFKGFGRDFGRIWDGFWLSLALLGSPWPSLALLSCPWLCLSLLGSFWLSLALLGFPCLSLMTCGTDFDLKL